MARKDEIYALIFANSPIDPMKLLGLAAKKVKTKKKGGFALEDLNSGLAKLIDEGLIEVLTQKEVYLTKETSMERILLEMIEEFKQKQEKWPLTKSYRYYIEALDLALRRIAKEQYMALRRAMIYSPIDVEELANFIEEAKAEFHQLEESTNLESYLSDIFYGRPITYYDDEHYPAVIKNGSVYIAIQFSCARCQRISPPYLIGQAAAGWSYAYHWFTLDYLGDLRNGKYVCEECQAKS